jgi:hypothetical protein
MLIQDNSFNLNQSIILKNRNCLYVTNPKCGCTTIMRMLLESENKCTPFEFDIFNIELHSKENPLMFANNTMANSEYLLNYFCSI